MADARDHTALVQVGTASHLSLHETVQDLLRRQSWQGYLLQQLPRCFSRPLFHSRALFPAGIHAYYKGPDNYRWADWLADRDKVIKVDQNARHFVCSGDAIDPVWMLLGHSLATLPQRPLTYTFVDVFRNQVLTLSSPSSTDAADVFTITEPPSTTACTLGVLWATTDAGWSRAEEQSFKEKQLAKIQTLFPTDTISFWTIESSVRSDDLTSALVDAFAGQVLAALNSMRTRRLTTIAMISSSKVGSLVMGSLVRMDMFHKCFLMGYTHKGYEVTFTLTGED